MDSRVILLTGQYGTGHEEVSRTLEKMASSRLARLSKVQPIIKMYSIEKRIWKTVTPEAYFELATDEERDKVWYNAFAKVSRQIKEDNPFFAIVSAHIVNYWKSRFFSSVNWDCLLTLRPKVILTLIANVYDIYHRIVEAQGKGEKIPQGRYSLPEIMSWRTREIHTCNLLAKHLYVSNLDLFPSVGGFLRDERASDHYQVIEELKQIINIEPCPHFVLSTQQSAEDFYRLLFERKRLRIYASFPISDPRKKKDRYFLRDLLTWRREIHKKFMVFDPLAIDEGRFEEDEIPNTGLTKVKGLTPPIPYSIGRPIVPKPGGNDTVFSLDELQKLRNLVMQQIGERDYKLVGQAHCVAMYRPLLYCKTHDGVNSEGYYAKAKKIPIHSYHPASDTRAMKPFEANIGSDHASLKKLMNALDEMQKLTNKNTEQEYY